MSATAPFAVCVYCGSRFGDDPAYREAAESLGRGLAARGMRLVYGAGDVGLMGAVARAAQDGGGDTFGVIPRHLQIREVGKEDISRYVVTETMHERKKVMFMNCHAVVALPGGPGTLDELFEALTWRQLGLHEKPVFALNVKGYWDGLVELINHLAARGFCDESFKAFLETVGDVDALLDRLDAEARRLRETT